jgi:HK97 family phage major capsid protein
MSNEFLDEAAFQSRVIGSVDRLETEMKSMKAKVDSFKDPANTSPEIKSALEDLTKLKRVANDQQANFDAFTRKLSTIESLCKREARHSYGSPIERVKNDPEMRIRLNAAVRLAVRKPECISQKMRDEYKEITGRALGEESSPGSNLIDDKLAAEIYDTLATYGIWNTFSVVNVGTATTKFPVTTARPTASFITTEAGTVSDGSFTGTSVSLTVEVIAALLNVSVQLLEDSEFDVTGYVMDHFAQAYANRLDYACLAANGTVDATNGGMTGIFSGGTAATADAGAGADDTVEELEVEDWIRCLTTVDPIVLARQAKWWMHPQILARTLAIKDSNGRPIFLTAMEAPTVGAIGSILGYPVVPALAAPSTNSASQKVAVFGDPAGLVVGIRKGFTFEASDEFRWNTLERSFRGYGRAGTKIRAATAFAMLTLGA